MADTDKSAGAEGDVIVWGKVKVNEKNPLQRQVIFTPCFWVNDYFTAARRC
jgi:hypothetical protein